jgi:dolichol kinase
LELFPFLLGLSRKENTFSFLPTESLIIFLTQTIKRITAKPRPFFHQPQILGVTSNIPTDYSFPSLHAAIATFFAWTLTFIYPKLSWLWFGILAVIAISRVSLGLHYPKDVLGGFFLATLTFWLVYLVSLSKKSLSWAADVNVRRKIIHLSYGLILVFLLDYHLISTIHFFYWLIFSLSLVLVSPWLPTRLRMVIDYFEREKKKRFLATGPFLFTLSSFISWVIFPKEIALISILNLALGDSINALAGSFLAGKKKRLEAGAAAFFATLLVSSQYITPLLAVSGSLVTFIFEMSEPKFRGKKIDDNLLIPPLSGSVIWLVSLLS